MKSNAMFRRMLLMFALMASLFSASLLVQAQNEGHAFQSAQTAQKSAIQSADQDADQTVKKETFTGVIAKSGDRLVLSDPLTKTIFQLDDQRKAQELVNKNVKVTGVLDPSTGTIRVSAIEPI